jgi:hypothetical protein
MAPGNRACEILIEAYLSSQQKCDKYIGYLTTARKEAGELEVRVMDSAIIDSINDAIERARLEGYAQGKADEIARRKKASRRAR